jgi:uncharacterized protein
VARGARLVRIQSLKNQALIADKCLVAESFLQRLKGLIGTTRLDAGQGILFPRCNDIHMWFMSIPIDVVFLRGGEPRMEGGTTWRVSAVRPGVRPWRVLPVVDRKASQTLELPAGTIERHGIREGDELCIV